MRLRSGWCRTRTPSLAAPAPHQPESHPPPRIRIGEKELDHHAAPAESPERARPSTPLPVAIAAAVKLSTPYLARRSPHRRRLDQVAELTSRARAPCKIGERGQETAVSVRLRSGWCRTRTPSLAAPAPHQPESHPPPRIRIGEKKELDHRAAPAESPERARPSTPLPVAIAAAVKLSTPYLARRSPHRRRLDQVAELTSRARAPCKIGERGQETAAVRLRSGWCRTRTPSLAAPAPHQPESHPPPRIRIGEKHKKNSTTARRRLKVRSERDQAPPCRSRSRRQ